jgi:type IV pilus assembly protein PilE
LASIALPAYTDQMKKSRRADVQRQLVSRAQELERYFSTNGRYSTAASGTTCGGADPSSSYYGIATACTDTTFTITATPGSSGPQASDGTQTLTQDGTRGGSVNSGNWRM